jgi:hypothetical protein
MAVWGKALTVRYTIQLEEDMIPKVGHTKLMSDAGVVDMDRVRLMVYTALFGQRTVCQIVIRAGAARYVAVRQYPPPILRDRFLGS